MNVLIFANGPGELAERAMPLANLLRSQLKYVKIFLIITPCQFSSGTELKVASHSLLFDKIFILKNLFNSIRDLSFKRIDVIFHVGGDILYPVLFSLILHAKLYSYGTFFIRHFVSSYLVPFPFSIGKAIIKGIPIYKLKFVGNFSFYSSSGLSVFSRKREGEWKIGLFPGSRRLQFAHLFPFFAKVLEELKREGYKLKSYLFLSPFISIEFLEEVVRKGPTYNVLDYSLGNLKEIDGKIYMVTSSGFRIEIEKEQKKIRSLDFAITTPGTSTLTLSHFGIPMLVVAPFNKPEEIPLNGILNFINYIPWIGPIFKRKIVYNYLRKKKFLALPNIIDNRKLVEEIKGELTLACVKERVKFLISSKKSLYKTQRDLLEFGRKYRLRKSKLLEFLIENE